MNCPRASFQRRGWPTVLLAAKTYGSVFYDKLTPSIARRGSGRSHLESRDDKRSRPSVAKPELASVARELRLSAGPLLAACALTPKLPGVP
jgi:hypothetical protein